LHKGWTLIFVDNDNKGDIPLEERSLLKLSPSRFFHPSVRLAMYLDKSFHINPTVDDVRFTTTMLDRHREGHDSQSRFKDPYHEGREVFYTSGAEQRHAVLLLPGFKGMTENSEVASHQIRLREAIQLMTDDLQADVKSKAFLIQRKYIESANSYFNRLELGARHDEFCKYSIRHWARSSWLVHDIQAEMGQKLRCEWYQEHMHWGNDLDQLTFAHIMARLDIERRVGGSCEPLEPRVSSLDGKYTDEKEWFLIAKSDTVVKSPPYVRILGTRTAVFERILWKRRIKSQTVKNEL